MKFKSLVGKTFTSIIGSIGDAKMIFTTVDGIKFEMYHEQDCCESVYIEDICGDLDDLIGIPIVIAEESIFVGENPQGVEVPQNQCSFTWTFYLLSTIKGSVTIRWYGSSNGYYSERVTLTCVS